MAVTFKDWKTGEVTTMFEGAVLADRERNGYDDSDFYVIAWDEEQQALRNYEYASTRYGGTGGASVDATPEVKEKARKWVYKLLRKYVWDHYVEGLSKPEKGDHVKVVKGRKGKGAEGTLFWIGEERTYGGYSKWSQNTVQKVGIALDDEKDEKGWHKNVAWSYLHNLEVQPDSVKAKFSYREIRYRLRNLKENYLGSWGAFMSGAYFWV